MIAWLDLSSGVSGDMLLGALVDAGVQLGLMQAEIACLGLPIELVAEPTHRAGLAATRVHVITHEQNPPARTLPQIRVLLNRVTPPVTAAATRTFGLLAAAEAQVHGISADEVHFHEVGALDALADVAGACAGLLSLGLDGLIAGPIALGGGTVATAHGQLPMPGPAVLEILRAAGAPAMGGGEFELCTPTGAALVAAHATGFGPMPPMTVTAIGSGAGSRDISGRPNVARLVIGEPLPAPSVGQAIVIEANIDDLDPRAWPVVLQALLAAGADDAWLTPIIMKKGRPAHTLSALAGAAAAPAVRAALFRETSTLGVRETPAAKTALTRTFRTVEVGGQPIAVKLGWAPDGSLLNAMPEWDDVVRAAGALGLPVKRVLAQAQAAFEQLPPLRPH
jgi:pyridinium-3,5-bisthiocarboxylic acid mononucleotide nickel chelatase